MHVQTLISRCIEPGGLTPENMQRLGLVLESRMQYKGRHHCANDYCSFCCGHCYMGTSTHTPFVAYNEGSRPTE